MSVALSLNKSEDVLDMNILQINVQNLPLVFCSSIIQSTECK